MNIQDLAGFGFFGIFRLKLREIIISLQNHERFSQRIYQKEEYKEKQTTCISDN